MIKSLSGVSSLRLRNKEETDFLSLLVMLDSFDNAM